MVQQTNIVVTARAPCTSLLGQPGGVLYDRALALLEVLSYNLLKQAQFNTVVTQNHDMATNDFLIGLVEQHEKIAWMKGHIQKENRDCERRLFMLATLTAASQRLTTHRDSSMSKGHQYNGNCSKLTISMLFY